jgi:hypothetical protein
MRQAIGVDVLLERVEIRRLAVGRHDVSPAIERNLSVLQRHPARGDDSPEAEVEPDVPREPLDLQRDLIEERGADMTRPDEADRDRVR